MNDIYQTALLAHAKKPYGAGVVPRGTEDAEALNAGKLWGAGIDVFENEPVERDHPLLSAPHTVLTPHAAYWSEESGEELRRRAMQAAIDVVSGVRPMDCLNPEALRF